ncbi:MAG: hypothetical protein V1810_01985 [Candidatus Beckwithbacteria bacterium]
MNSMKIATVINYCSNDYHFIQPAINQTAKFSQQIIVPYCDHFYDASLENKSLIQQTIKANPQVQFVEFPYNPQATRTLWRGWQFILRHLGLGRVWGPQYWICYARRLGFTQVNDNIDYVLFLDADEIIDAKRFLQWLNIKNYQKFDALKLATYWYWRSPSYQADVWEDNPLLARRSSLAEAIFMDHEERNAIYKSISGEKIRMVLGLDRQPMIHHYGWAKPKENLLKKVKTWGHNKDRNWIKLIHQEFSHPFSGQDFLYPKRHYQIVKPFIK